MHQLVLRSLGTRLKGLLELSGSCWGPQGWCGALKRLAGVPAAECPQAVRLGAGRDGLSVKRFHCRRPTFASQLKQLMNAWNFSSGYLMTVPMNICTHMYIST